MFNNKKNSSGASASSPTENDRAFPLEYYVNCGEAIEIKKVEYVEKDYFSELPPQDDIMERTENGKIVEAYYPSKCKLITTYSKDIRKDEVFILDLILDAVDLKYRSNEEKYQYKNDIVIYSPIKDSFFPYRFFYKDIEVTEGKIKFILDDGDVLIVEDKKIKYNICNNNEDSSTNKYDSFFGKKSILEHHCDLLYIDSDSYGWINGGTSYHLSLLSECIHDGVTSFVLLEYPTWQLVEEDGDFYFEYNDDISDEEDIAD